MRVLLCRSCHPLEPQWGGAEGSRGQEEEAGGGFLLAPRTPALLILPGVTWESRCLSVAMVGRGLRGAGSAQEPPLGFLTTLYSGSCLEPIWAGVLLMLESSSCPSNVTKE